MVSKQFIMNIYTFGIFLLKMRIKKKQKLNKGCLKGDANSIYG